MTKHTNRDEVWNHALRLATDGREFIPKEIADLSGASERTTRDVLATMRDMEWLSVNEKKSFTNTYDAGEKIPPTLFNVKTND